MPKHTLPSATVAPATAEPWHEVIPSRRLNAECDRVAMRTPIAPRNQENEDERCRDDPDNQDPAEEYDKDRRVRHANPPCCMARAGVNDGSRAEVLPEPLDGARPRFLARREICAAGLGLRAEKPMSGPCEDLLLERLAPRMER